MPPLQDIESQRCPYCGEDVELDWESGGPGLDEYVEDCPICCRPWTVRMWREQGKTRVQLLRGDD